MFPQSPSITFKRAHKLLNDLLTVSVLILALYILLAPLIPLLSYKLHNANKHSATATPAPISSTKVLDDGKEVLSIPSIYLNEDIHEGKDQSILRQGVWRLPFSSTPAEGNNTVIAGHRFYYTSKAVFYNLDKVQLGDLITVRWHGKTYTYKVFGIQTVAPSETSVQAPTADARLTLYTCTPLWTSKSRLVITASLAQGVKQ